MSAKRRQETIARFSVPIEEDESPALTLTQAPSATQARSTRRRSTRASSQAVVDLTADDDQDGDFVMPVDDETDDDFIVDDSDDDRPKKKGKGKGKGKAKAKSKAAVKTAHDLPDGVNPRVMLISLKAGALGLNLTVANNVYLYVIVVSSQTAVLTSFAGWIRELRASVRRVKDAEVIIGGGKKELNHKPSIVAIGPFKILLR